ncbi:Kinesin-like protein kif9 [Entophlyctis sp. JEL0112]|nr:Kinesin-like protein kif9 [Entophlyctis sp. JEL0112]
MSLQKEKENKHVKVIIRTRPTVDFENSFIKFDADNKNVHIHIPKGSDGGFINNQQENWDFRFDNILHNASQDKVYEECATSIVKSVMEGYHGTIMAYGQTGAGKTFTMTGATENYKHRGLIPRAISHIFREIADRPQMAFTVRISYLEIYNEQIADLLSPSPTAVDFASESHTDSYLTVVDDKNGAAYVKGLTMQIANNEEEALNLLFEGETTRSIAEHQLNKLSTRSHCIFTIYLDSRSRVESSEKVISSKLNLVDLAGSERISKTRTHGVSLKEAMYINKSLTFLEQVIVALSDKRRDHIPYRQSKLTNVLRDSLGGNCNTLMIANIWGVKEHIEETISTLRFATRMMCVSNTPLPNITFDPIALIKKHEKHIRELKQELAMHDSLCGGRGHVQYDPFGDSQRAELAKTVKAFLKGDGDAEIEGNKIISLRQVRECFAQFKILYHTLEVERDDLIAAVKRLSAGAIAANGAGDASGGGLVGEKSGQNEFGSRYLYDYDHEECVGETEPSGFSVGLAPSTGKDNQYRLLSKKKKGGPIATSKPSPVINSTAADEEEDHAEKDTNPEHLPALPKANGRGSHQKNMLYSLATAPAPSRAEEFEAFKKTRGAELNRVLVENKSTLKEKKKQAISLTAQVTSHKAQIDSLKRQIEVRRTVPTAVANHGSDVIIDEEEYLLIEALKGEKQAYREAVESLKSVADEVQYVERLVATARQRLMSEFEAWFDDMYGIDGEERDRRAAELSTPPPPSPACPPSSVDGSVTGSEQSTVNVGLRARTRHLFARDFRTKGQIKLSTYLVNYKVGDIVDIKANGAVQKGMPHKYYHGKTGIVYNVTKSAVGVIVNKRVGGRYIEKRVNIRVEHIKHSKCRDDFLKRVRANDRAKAEAKITGVPAVVKRLPAQPRPAHFVSAKKNAPVTVAPIPYEALV